MKLRRPIIRNPSGFLGVCFLWGAVLLFFSFIVTYHLSRHHPTDLANSEDPVELERQLRRRIEGLQEERAVLGDEPVAGRVQWLMQTVEQMKSMCVWGVTSAVANRLISAYCDLQIRMKRWYPILQPFSRKYGSWRNRTRSYARGVCSHSQSICLTSTGMLQLRR